MKLDSTALDTSIFTVQDNSFEMLIHKQADTW